MPSNHDDGCRVLTIPEAASVLGIGRNAAYDAAKRGDIPTIKIGRLIRVPKKALDQLLETFSSVSEQGSGAR